MSRPAETYPIDAAWLRVELADRIAAGQRLAGLIGSGAPVKGITLTAMMATSDTVEPVDAHLPAGTVHYPALTPTIPAAFWYERALHDLFGVLPQDHPRLDPLILPHGEEPGQLPCPGSGSQPDRVAPDERALPQRVLGPGVFTIPHGPVRSGVFESVEYVVETPGEDIPHVNVRPFAKHRGIQNRFEGMSIVDGSLLAERVEGIASVAHAIAYCHAIEGITATAVPPVAALVRALHAELERIANHLDVAMKLADAAGLAVAVARFGWHKERVLRIVGQLCGNRFGRGVVIPGGVQSLPRLDRATVRARLSLLRKDITGDADALMDSASFLDRLRGTGPIDHRLARDAGAIGPVGRASGVYDDCRWSRPYDSYLRLTPVPGEPRDDGDAMARLQVRWTEITGSFALLEEITDLLGLAGLDVSHTPAEPGAGRAIGWAEAPQGEVLYLVELGTDGRIVRCAPRSASFHNLALFSSAFQGDVLTDFPFIEASFGLSIAGVVM